MEKFDKLFDCLKVSSMSQGKVKQSRFKSPYQSIKNFRLKVHIMSFDLTGSVLYNYKISLLCFPISLIQWLETDFFAIPRAMEV